jgi:hypothetical protein
LCSTDASRASLGGAKAQNCRPRPLRYPVAPGGYPVPVFVFDRVGQHFAASLLSIGLMRLVFYFFTRKVIATEAPAIFK